MTKPLRETGAKVWASDVFDYGGLDAVSDFLFDPPRHTIPADWIITNPPFRLAWHFAEKGLRMANNVALFVRLQFLEGIKRGESLFDPSPPNLILLFRERVTLLKGRCLPQTETGSQTSTAYCWLLWFEGGLGDQPYPHFDWIRPCRKRLERPGDYDET